MVSVMIIVLLAIAIHGMKLVAYVGVHVLVNGVARVAIYNIKVVSVLIDCNGEVHVHDMLPLFAQILLVLGTLSACKSRSYDMIIYMTLQFCRRTIHDGS